MISYDDFSIRIDPRQGQHFPARAEWKHAVVVEKIDIPWLDRLDEILTAVGHSVRGEELEAPRDLARRPPVVLPDQLGADLFRCLFTGSIKDLFHESRGDGRPLRIRLQMNLSDPTLTPVASLPWELMYNEEQRESLALTPDWTIVRYPDLRRTVEILPFQPPLRLLFVAANPRGDLDLAQEFKRIEKALADARADVVTELLENATFADLEEQLHEKNYHIVHFMGHGDFHDGIGVLSMQDGPRSGSALGRLLLREKKTRLVFLNACRTARVSRVEGQDPFAGVATAMLMAGIPAVLAMQFPILDEHAREFAVRFYSEIARGNPVEQAVDAGRMKLHAIASEKREWATPVLFLRRDGNLFVPPAAGTTRRATVSRDDLVYMLNRDPVIRGLEKAMDQQRERPGVPLVAMIHGDDEQCQDTLIARLHEQELPAILRLDQRKDGIRGLYPKWPTSASDRQDFQEALTEALADEVVGDSRAGVDALRRAIASLPSAAAIYTQVLASGLEPQRRWDPLEVYLTWWNQWPQGVTKQRIFAFLFIKYDTPSEVGWLRRRQVNRSSDRIRKVLGRLDGARFQNIVLKVLPELSGVQEQDAVNWAGKSKLLHLCDDINHIFSEYKTESGSDRMPMRLITTRLRALLTEPNSATRGVV